MGSTVTLKFNDKFRGLPVMYYSNSYAEALSPKVMLFDGRPLGGNQV